MKSIHLLSLSIICGLSAGLYLTHGYAAGGRGTESGENVEPPVLSATSSGRRAAAPRIEPVRLGFIAPLTGLRASTGQNALDGARLALEEIAAQRKPEDPPLELVVEDSQSDPLRGIDAYHKLRLQQVRIVITMNSNVSLPISQLVNKDGIIQLAISTTSEKYKTADDLTFRTNGTTRQEAEYLAGYIAKRILASPNKLAVVAMEDQYPLNLRDNVLSQLEQAGIRPAYSDTFVPGTVDFRSIIVRLKQDDVRYVVLLSYQIEGGYFVKQQKELGLKPELLIGNVPINNPEFFAIAEDAAEGIVAAYIRYDEKHPAAARYRTRYGREPDYCAGNGYDAVMLANLALNKCGHPGDSICLKNALFATKNFNGLSGAKSCDAYGDMEDDYGLLIASRGRFVPFAAGMN